METARKTAIICSVVLVFSALLYFVFLVSSVLLYLLVSLFFAVAINPLVVHLKRLKMGRVLASSLSILLLLLVIIGILFTVVRPLVIQGADLAQNLPNIAHTISTNPTFIEWNQKYHFADNIDELSDKASKILMGGSSSLMFVVTNIATVASTIAILLVLTFLLLIQGGNIWKSLMNFLNEKNAQIANRIGLKIMKAISGFVSGNLLISLIAGLVTFITLWILDVPYMFALAVLVALFDLVPIVGATIATVAVALVALTKSVLAMLIVVAILLIYQFIENHIIQPMVYSRSVNLSALLVVIASLIGAEIAGITGLLLAIPVAAVVQILVMEFYTLAKARG